MGSAQDRGRAFEPELAGTLGVEAQRGSGNVWYAKLDIDQHGLIVWSLKHTGKDSYTVKPGVLNEARAAAFGAAGAGPGTIPAWAFDIAGRQYGMMELPDIVRALTDQSMRIIKPSKGEVNRKLADMPGILRRQMLERDE